MGDDFEVIGRIIVDSAGAVGLEMVNSELDTMQAKTGLLSGVTRAFGDVARYVWANLVLQGITMAIDAVKEFVTGSIDAAKSHQVVQALLANQIRDTGAAVGMTADKVNALAAQYSKLTGFTQDQIVKGETQLLMFQKINSNIFPQAAQLAMDLARSKSIDLTSAFQMMGRALGDPAMGIGRLNMQFRLFDKEQLKTIEDMAKGGDVMGAQKLIIDALTAKIGGAAKAYGETFAGKMDIFNARLEELKISVGNFLIPILTRFIGLIIDSGIIDQLQAFFDSFQAGNIKITGLSNVLAFFGHWWEVNGPVIVTNGQRILNSLRSAFDTLSPIISKFMHDVLGDLEKWFTANGPLIQRFSKVVADAFINVILPAIGIAIGLILPLIRAAIDIILQLGTIIMSVATGDWSGAWNAIKSIASTALNAIKNFVMSAATALVKALGFTPNDIATTWKGNWNTFISIVRQGIIIAIDAVRNTVADWVSVGRAMISGLISGVQSMVSSFLSTIKGIVNQAINIVNNLLHIRSPSGVFKNIGKSMMEGLALGIGDGLTVPITAITRGVPRLTAATALGSSQTTYYGGNTSYANRMHLGSVNNFYVGNKQSPSETLKQLRRM